MEKAQDYNRTLRTSDKYHRVRPEGNPENRATLQRNEIRITGNPRIARYITTAANLLLGEEKETKIVITATGAAIKNACLVAEILRHRIENLHQLLEISQIIVTDIYEPNEEGLTTVKLDKNLAVLKITLTQDPVAAGIDTKLPGYQDSLPISQIKSEPLNLITENTTGSGRGRGRGRGGRGRGIGIGIGRGRGRDFGGLREGGYGDERRVDFRPRPEGYKPRAEGGYRPRQEGGYRPRQENGYRPRQEESYRPEGDYRPRTEAGYKERQEGGSYRPRGNKDGNRGIGRGDRKENRDIA